MSRFLSAVLALQILGAPAVLVAELPPAPAFAQTWKMMSSLEKQQFVSGYLFGLRDAARMQDVTLTYIRENPNQAISGIERIRDILTAEGIRPDAMVKLVDQFFNDPKNREATITMAMSVARSRAN